MDFIKNKRRPIVLLLLFIIGMFLYSNILNAPFIFDDYEFIVENPHIRDIPSLSANWDIFGRRFVTMFTFAANYYFGGYNVLGYHLANVCIHILTAFLWYLLVLQILSVLDIEKTNFLKDRHLFALFCALIFLAHPLQTQSVNYIWQRSTLLTGFFYLASLVFYMRARIRRQKLYFLGVFFSFFIGFLCKGNIITLPLMIILLEVCFLGLRKSKRRLSIFFLVCGAAFFTIAGNINKLMGVLYRYSQNLPPKLPVSVEYLFTQFRVIVQYVKLLFLPIGQQVDYYFARSESLFVPPSTFFSLLILAGIIGLGIFTYRKYRLVSFGIFWFFIYLLPTSSIVDLGTVIWEHRAYLSVAGFSICLVSVLFGLLHRHRYVRNYLITGIILVLSIFTLYRNYLWREPVRLFEDTVQKSPLNPRARLVLGSLYYQKGKLKKAYEEFKKAEFLDPEYPHVHNNLGLIYFRLGFPDKAKEEFRKSIKYRNVVRYIDPYINLAGLLIREEKIEEAEEILKEALSRWKYSDSLFVAMGNLYLAKGKYEESEKYFKKSLGLNPLNQMAYFNLGNLYSDQEDFEPAIKMYQKALQIDPFFIDVYVNMGLTYYKMQDHKKCLQAIDKALELNPQRQIVYKKMADLYRKLGEEEKVREVISRAKELYRLQEEYIESYKDTSE